LWHGKEIKICRNLRKGHRQAKDALPSAGTRDRLSGLFNVAAMRLAANRSPLSQADRENRNHADNMVPVFNTIAGRASFRAAALRA
jgi:hypothetical protein